MTIDVELKGPAKKVDAAKLQKLRLVSHTRSIVDNSYSAVLQREDGMLYQVVVPERSLVELLAPTPWQQPKASPVEEHNAVDPEELREMFEGDGDDEPWVK